MFNATNNVGTYKYFFVLTSILFVLTSIFCTYKFEFWYKYFLLYTDL